MVDILHTVDLGITAHIAGNILWELIEEHVWGETHQESQLSLQMELKSWYSKNPRLHRLQGPPTFLKRENSFKIKKNCHNIALIKFVCQEG